MEISKNFTMEEMVKSNTAKRLGINNTPSEEETRNIIELVEKILQPIRNKYGKPIYVNSGFRCEELNKAVGGSKTSQHRYGSAVDIEASNGNNTKLFYCIKEMIEKGEIEVGQLIWEYGNKKNPNWVHVSLPMPHKKNQILYLYS